MASQFRPFTQKLVDILTIIILFLNGSTETAIVMDNCKSGWRISKIGWCIGRNPPSVVVAFG
jgi:hypothetical protein